MEDSDHGRSMRRLKRKPDGFTSLEISDIVLRGQELGLHEIVDNDNRRFARVTKRKSDEFSGLQRSKFSQILGVHGIEDNGNERFIRPLKTEPDDFPDLQLSNTGFIKIEDNDYEDNEDDIDPQYEMFLKKMRVDGKFYALEAGKRNGSPFYLNYHEGDSDDEAREPTNLKSVQGRERRGLVEYDEDRELPTRWKISNGKKKMKKQIQARKYNGKKRSLMSVQGRERRDLVEYDEDVELTTKGRMRNDKKEVKTQVQVRTDDRRKLGSPRNYRNIHERERRDLLEYDEETERPSRRIKKNGEKEVKTQVQVRSDKKRKMESRRHLGIVLGRERRDLVKYDEDDPSVDQCYQLFLNGQKDMKTQIQVRKENRKKMESPRNLSSVKGREKRDLVEYDVDDRSVDECYQLFLNGIIKEDKYIYVCSSGKRVVYEDDEAESSDSEIEVWDHAPYDSEGNPSPFVSQRKDRSSGISEFREKLMSILKRPFNQKEYERLLLDIKAQKSAGHIKDLRSRPISFSVAGLTKSLLDRHRDVEREINAVRHNRPKVLNILRGFFYWLENIANEGAFKPWKDASCRAMLPSFQVVG